MIEHPEILSIFVINGSGGVGKDTFVNFVAEDNRVVHLSSINKVKEIATLIGWDGIKDEKSRKLLSDLKQLTTDYNDMSFNYICDLIDNLNNMDNYGVYVFVDIREPEEIKRFIKRYPYTQTILITNKNVESIKSNKSDAEVYDYNYDYIVENDGSLEDLQVKAGTFECYQIYYD